MTNTSVPLSNSVLDKEKSTYFKFIPRKKK